MGGGDYRGEGQMFPARKLATALGAAITTLATASPAEAGLDACNKTTEEIVVAIAHSGDQGWISLGWWAVQPKSCLTLLQGDLQSRYYYVYAESDFGDYWGGSHNFCVQDEKFDIVGADDCEARGYQTVGFHEHDVGGNTDYTVVIGP
jgi:uncharacterized membrane protein